jgi:hypothetical protein
MSFAQMAEWRPPAPRWDSPLSISFIEREDCHG